VPLSGIGVIAAVAGEAMLLIAWLRLARDGEAPGLLIMLWIWPLAWLGCGLMGWAAARWAYRFAGPALDGGKLAMSMALNLLAGTLLTAVPIIVAIYAAFMLVIAMRI
jgi:hypothetical protein